MSLLLRVEMIILSLSFLIIVLRTINKRKLLVQYALIWIILAIGMLLLAIIPGMADILSQAVRIETTSNFIYLLAIVSLLILTFSLTVIISKQSVKIKNTIQMVSINSFLEKEGYEHGINQEK